MTARRRSGLEQFRRTLYKTQRAIGDGQALSRSPAAYAKRRARRSARRAFFGLLGGRW